MTTDKRKKVNSLGVRDGHGLNRGKWRRGVRGVFEFSDEDVGGRSCQDRIKASKGDRSDKRVKLLV